MHDFEIHVLPPDETGGQDVQVKQHASTYVKRTATGAALGPAHVLGEGQLNWNRSERVSDRYGAVGLYVVAHWQSGQDSTPLAVQGLVGKRGQLRAVVLETRTSDHLGDLTHGWLPGGAEVGKTYVLGEGILFHEDNLGPKVGLEPTDGRPTHWLDGPTLYMCHEQTVRLEFAPFVE